MVFEPYRNVNSKESVETSSNNIADVKMKKKYERVKKVILGVLKSHDLDIKDIVITQDGKYLISCGEVWQNEKPKVFIWSIEKVLEGKIEPEAILEGEIKQSEGNKINNWLLCVDSLVMEVNSLIWWIVCAGGINGDIYIWRGKVDSVSKEWILKEFNHDIISEGDEDLKTFNKAIFAIKILEDSVQNNSCQVYFALNNIQVISKNKTKDNLLKQLTITLDDSGKILKNKPSSIIGIQDEWILTFDLYINKENNIGEFLVSGSRDGNVYKWNLTNESKNKPILIGNHIDSVACVKIFEDGTNIASSSHDQTIRIWKNNDTNNPDLINELLGHDGAVVSIYIQKNNKLLISASKDNNIKIWDLDQKTWIRSINMEYFMDKYKGNGREFEEGINFLSRVLISPDNRHIIAVRKNKIIILRNFGPIWHFNEQLKYIKKKDKELYQKIYGDNLKQIAKSSAENIESLRKIYDIIKKRLNKAEKVKLAFAGDRIASKASYINLRELGSLFIPNFIMFEENINTQKELITGVKDKYDEFWHSIKNSFFKIPDALWGFKLFITTDMEENIKEAKFIEITGAKNDPPYIILKDRGQSQIRFLMVLNNIPASFIPIINNININIEDDRGDKDNLVFSDFMYSKNFIKILTNPHDSSKDFKPLINPESIFYADCIFQLQEGYSTEKLANLFVRKITLEFIEKLNPLEMDKSDREDIDIFNAFKNNFQYPIIPKIRVQIGKGVGSAMGKLMDSMLTKLVVIEFLVTIWEIIIPVVLTEELHEIASLTFGIIQVFIVLIIMITLLKKK